MVLVGYRHRKIPEIRDSAPSGIMWYLRYQLPMPGTHISYLQWLGDV